MDGTLIIPEDTYIVLGFSIAGVAAAIEIKTAGFAVTIVDFDPGVGTFLSIGPTPLNVTPVSGLQWEQMARQRLTRAKISSVPFLPTVVDQLRTVGQQFVSFLQWTGEGHRVVFAPTGELTTSQDIDVHAHENYGYTLCFDAESDASFFAGKHVAVAGCTYSAVDQACRLARCAGMVTLICEDRTLATSAMQLTRLPEYSDLHIRYDCTITAIQHDEDWRITGLHLSSRASGDEYLLPIAGLFMAQRVTPGWHWCGGYEAAVLAMQQARLYPAGIAAGIDDGAHMELYSDGVRAARLALKGVPSPGDT